VVTFSSDNSSVERGGSLTMTASIFNIGTTTMPGTTATISLPSGWTTSSATANVGSIAAGASAKASWTVNVASDAAYGTHTSTVSVAYTGGPGDTTASRAIQVPYPHLTVVSADSQETVGENAPATNAVDGDPDTIWHTKWSGTSDPMPHEITLDLGSNKSAACLYYLPRQSGSNGRIAKYEVYTSMDGTTWGNPVATGTWTDTADQEQACFTPVSARYIRLRALSEVNGNPWTSAAEINVGLAG
jgi:hypothetical protein